MEWYPVSCVTNAKDQEWVPSPDSLCQWETGPPQTWECLEANGGEFYQQIGHQIGSKDPFTVSGWNIWCEDMWSDHTDFQLDNLEGIGRPNDDMILNCCSSAANKKSHRSINMECDSGYQCQCEGCWPMDGFCSEAIRQVQWMDYCASYFLSPSISWENETDMETVQHVPCSINDQESNSPAKVSMINIVIPAGNENIKSACGVATLKEISLEESVLHGLEMVTSQLTEETRICFRNALYRLADHSSRQQLNQHQGSTNMGNDSSNSPPPPPPPSEHNNKRNKRMTQRRRITKESETNIIERTVAKMSDLAQQQPQNNMLEERP